MLKAKWSQFSLTFWVTLSTVLTAVPLALSAVAVHLLFSYGVVAAYDDVTRRYREHLGPVHQLEMALWEAHSHADHYLETQEIGALADYKRSRGIIAARFDRLRDRLDGLQAEQATLARARAHWSRSDELAWPALTSSRQLETRTADVVEDELALALAEMRKVRVALGEDVAADHLAAAAAFRRSTWLSAIAGVVSLATLIAGVVLISRIMLRNVDRLVRGARKFAAGDREHVIDIRVPIELREVASEFNRMIGRIREAEDALAAEARQDPLTGLPNRRSFEVAATDAVARLLRFEEPFALVMFDIDHFKHVNDTHGHAAGDAVLRAVGAAVAGTIRAVDKAFRVGGEEFAVLIAATDVTGATLAAERLRRTIAETVVSTSGTEIVVTASFGVAPACAGGTIDELCREADGALYEAKTSGRNRLVVAAPPEVA